jgi:hypothetical protein
MGTTLTGTKPKDTYDSLIKVGDNGPISGTAKTLSDGLGNDLPISVSTSNVGIGTGAPQSTLDVRKLSTNLGTTSELGLLISNTGVLGQYAQIGFGYSESTCAAVIAGVITSASGATTSNLVFATRSGTGGATAPVERMRVTANGLTFNGDTAAANALDDYEEGTWTVAITGVSGNPTYTGTTTGYYTKIGNAVHYHIEIELSSFSGGSGSVRLSLPFTVGTRGYNMAATQLRNIDFSNTGVQVGYEATQGTAFGVLIVQEDNAGSSQVQCSGMTATSVIRATGTFFV